jgi:DNA-binding beta-propeller fold protein YncE
VRPSARLAAIAACGLGLAVPAVAAATPRATLHVAISVPAALSSNGREVWLANTGTGSVLELSATTGKELLNVSGTKLRLDNSDGIAQVGNDVWVANEASNTVTEFYAKTGALKHVLAGPKYRLAVPAAIVVADGHVFVLSLAGDKVTMLVEKNARLARYLAGPRFHFDHAVGIVRVGKDVWVVSSGARGGLTELSGATGGVMRIVTASTAHLVRPTAIATDGAHLLVTNAGGRRITILSTTGHYLGSLTTSRVDLDRATSIAAVDGTVWVASTTKPAYVIGLRERNGALVRAYRHRFGFPMVFSDAAHAWVVDRIQSEVTELSPRTGWPVRVISR